VIEGTPGGTRSTDRYLRLADIVAVAAHDSIVALGEPSW
jgi:hypothetical protein